MELELFADLGFIGLPNAGKSTLLGKISAAHPKVAPYPFTTLTPHVGVVELPEYARITVADIPGLIEGAHRNVGLGHDFLRHIVRCKVLVFIVDMAGSDPGTSTDVQLAPVFPWSGRQVLGYPTVFLGSSPSRTPTSSIRATPACGITMVSPGRRGTSCLMSPPRIRSSRRTRKLRGVAPGPSRRHGHHG